MHFIVSILMATTAFLVVPTAPTSAPVIVPESMVVSAGTTIGGDFANITNIV